MKNREFRVLLWACACLLCAGATAPAGYMSTSGMIQIIAPPPSVKPGDLMSNTLIHTFAEHHELTLTSSVAVDDTASGTFTKDSQLVAGSIAAGTKVDSYFFHSDPVSAEEMYTASVTFSSAILGVIVLSDTLSATDAQLGAPGTKYPTGDSERGMELSTTEDSFTLSADLKTLTLHFNTHGNVDEVRVLTVATVPEPFSAALLGLGGLGLAGVARLRRGSKRARDGSSR